MDGMKCKMMSAGDSVIDRVCIVCLPLYTGAFPFCFRADFTPLFAPVYRQCADTQHPNQIGDFVSAQTTLGGRGRYMDLWVLAQSSDALERIASISSVARMIARQMIGNDTLLRNKSRYASRSVTSPAILSLNNRGNTQSEAKGTIVPGKSRIPVMLNSSSTWKLLASNPCLGKAMISY